MSDEVPLLLEYFHNINVFFETSEGEKRTSNSPQVILNHYREKIFVENKLLKEHFPLQEQFSNSSC